LTSINVEKNNIPAAQEEEIYQHVRMNKLRVALRDEALTELDVSGIGFGVEGAKVVARYVSDNEALTSLHVGQNVIPQKEMREIIVIAMRMDNMKILCEVPFNNKTLIELDVSGENLGMEGALVIAEYLDGNEALMSLDLSSNFLKVEGAKIVVEAIKVSNYAIAVVLAPVSCLSDHWLNCRCLLLSTGHEGIAMYRRHTLPVKKEVDDVYPRVPPLFATRNTAHNPVPVSAYTHITHDL
jgi:hypothetical protein